MLPIFRIIPAGGVILALTIVILALNTPDRSRFERGSAMYSAHGALQRADEHPEWRQNLIQAAIRRAEELSRLRDLPERPVHPDDAAKVAGLPASRTDADPSDVTGSINDAPGATLPMDIGETSSTELPVRMPEERPATVKTPERIKPPNESQKKALRHSRRSRPPVKPQTVETFNLFELLFGKSAVESPSSDASKLQPSRRGAAAAAHPAT